MKKPLNASVLHGGHSFFSLQLRNPFADALSSIGGGRFLNVAFPLAIGVYCLAGIMTEVDLGADARPLVDSFEAALQFCVIGLLIVKIAAQQYTVGSGLLLVVSAGLICFSALHAGSYALLWMLLFIASAQGENIKSVLRVGLLTLTLGTILVCVLSIIGVLPNEVLLDTRAIRYSLGFKHPNMLAKNLVSISISLLMLRFESLSWKNLIYSAVIVLISYVLTASRTFTAVGIFALVLVVCARRWGRGVVAQRHSVTLAVIRVSLFVLIVIVSVVSMLWFNQDIPLFGWANRLLSERLRLAHEFYVVFPPTLWGNHQESMVLSGVSTGEAQTSFLVDNAYAHLILAFGVIATLLFLALYFVALWDRGRGSVSVITLGLIICAVTGIGESCMFDCRFNPYYLIACAELLYPSLMGGMGSNDRSGHHISHEKADGEI